jgi:hypothetical protein
VKGSFADGNVNIFVSKVFGERLQYVVVVIGVPTFKMACKMVYGQTTALQNWMITDGQTWCAIGLGVLWWMYS